ncbi:hypothetical protein DMB66_18855 [Actinoplanes sp. ATCC 53533]|uniref:hypothetical protein n=1 Tax=Actinoplanes sp. ATCC 53533 TaxID=1288362 RepID=UPI000F77091C|nr:hypothetical protein [Actinoplanes sp. ATCC 53533]RSM64708.1 hypothetical protein DMB66_18855 [Actinoplanes sp. ATCC 53533]
MTNHVLSVLIQMPAERLPTVIARLTAEGDLLGRAVAYGRSYQFDHRPQTLMDALADLEASSGSTADRSAAARFLALRVIEATLVGQRVGTSRVISMLAGAEDDPDDHGSLDGLRAMAYAAGALGDEPGTDPAAALAELDAMSPPRDSSYAALWPALRNGLSVRIAADRQDMSLMPDVSAQVAAMKADHRFGPAQHPAIELMEIMSEMMAAVQRRDVAAATAATTRMRAALDHLPAGDPTVDALRAQLNAAMSQLG